jgi:CDP-2,3-bis-(O-geranylgeranyl)-sn-glycerol synthase
MTSDILVLLYAKLLLLIGIANGTPLFAHTLMRQRFNQPLDGGAQFLDGRPLFGPSKTIRGVGLALLVTPACALLLGLGATTGLAVGLGAMLGDVCSSFAKRRLGLAPSSQAFGLDQIPESLFPLLAVRPRYDLDGTDIGAMVVAFVVLELLVSRVLFKFRLRDQPY